MTTVTVVGSFQFPIDMLRYDRCTPNSESDSSAIDASFWPRSRGESRKERRIAVRHESTQRPSAVGPFTPARWASFGWDVDVSTMKTEVF